MSASSARPARVTYVTLRGLSVALATILLGCSPAAAEPSLQAQIDDMAKLGGTVEIPAGTFDVDLRLPQNVSLEGQGRESTILRGAVTVTGTTMQSAFEIDYASRISDIGFEGSGACLHYVGVAYFEVSRVSFRGCETGLWLEGALQAQIDDTKFVANATGLRLSAATGTYCCPILPPNRVLVSWSTFYNNTAHAIDYSQGSQLLVEDSEFGANGTAGDETTSAIWVHDLAYGPPPAQGLVMRGGWMEGNLGLAAVVIGPASVATEHSITDTYMPTNDARYAISVDGSANTLILDRVLIAAANREINATDGAVVQVPTTR